MYFWVMREKKCIYLIWYVIAIITGSVYQVKVHFELESVQEAVFILITKLPDLDHSGVRQLVLIQQEVPHRVPWYPASLGLQLVKQIVVPSLVPR